jgi:MEKHLA domain
LKDVGENGNVDRLSSSIFMFHDRPPHPSMAQHVQRLMQSFEHWLGKPLLPVSADPDAMAQALFYAPFVVVSHGIEPDPILNYGNQQALHLWEMDWSQFTQTPSRCTAEPIAQAERSRLLQQAKKHGFISNYQGIRISSTGKRFWIREAIIWDVLDKTGVQCGQAATFDRWDRIQC